MGVIIPCSLLVPPGELLGKRSYFTTKNGQKYTGLPGVVLTPISGVITNPTYNWSLAAPCMAGGTWYMFVGPSSFFFGSCGGVVGCFRRGFLR